GVVGGGGALEVRVRGAPRLPGDTARGPRRPFAAPAALRGGLIGALTADPDGDGFLITPGPPAPLREDGGGHLTWRVPVSAQLAGKRFGGTHLDVSPRPHELGLTDRLTKPNSLWFASIPTPVMGVL